MIKSRIRCPLLSGSILLIASFLRSVAFRNEQFGAHHHPFGVGRRSNSLRFAAPAEDSPDSDLDWLQRSPPDSSETQIMPQSRRSGAEQRERPDNIQIPSTGISVSDEIQEDQKDKFQSELVPIKDLPGVAQIVTTASPGGTIEPVRYLVALSPPPVKKDSSGEEGQTTTAKAENSTAPQVFVMVDAPPFSEKLAANIRAFMGGARLAAMLVTSRDAIHYDEAPAVFTTRKSDLSKWLSAFPGLQIVGYRLDIPRDCRELFTQRLDGYGPWALNESGSNVTFVETGRPLTYEVWDDAVTASVMDNGETPPDDAQEASDDHLYTPEAIREREEDRRVLAVYTPGHTFGSISFIFPETSVCCSGFTIPVEDDRQDENMGMSGAGPMLDFRGYITTSRAGISRMMESARHVIETYSDRFEVVLPSRGDPLFVDNMEYDERRRSLLGIIDQYEKIGKVYEQLGIVSGSEDD